MAHAVTLFADAGHGHVPSFPTPEPPNPRNRSPCHSPLAVQHRTPSPAFNSADDVHLASSRSRTSPVKTARASRKRSFVSRAHVLADSSRSVVDWPNTFANHPGVASHMPSSYKRWMASEDFPKTPDSKYDQLVREHERALAGKRLAEQLSTQRLQELQERVQQLEEESKDLKLRLARAADHEWVMGGMGGGRSDTLNPLLDFPSTDALVLQFVTTMRDGRLDVMDQLLDLCGPSGFAHAVLFCQDVVTAAQHSVVRSLEKYLQRIDQSCFPTLFAFDLRAGQSSAPTLALTSPDQTDLHSVARNCLPLQASPCSCSPPAIHCSSRPRSASSLAGEEKLLRTALVHLLRRHHRLHTHEAHLETQAAEIVRSLTCRHKTSSCPPPESTLASGAERECAFLLTLSPFKDAVKKWILELLSLAWACQLSNPPLLIDFSLSSSEEGDCRRWRRGFHNELGQDEELKQEALKSEFKPDSRLAVTPVLCLSTGIVLSKGEFVLLDRPS